MCAKSIFDFDFECRDQHYRRYLKAIPNFGINKLKNSKVRCVGEYGTNICVPHVAGEPLFIGYYEAACNYHVSE